MGFFKFKNYRITKKQQETFKENELRRDIDRIEDDTISIHTIDRELLLPITKTTPYIIPPLLKLTHQQVKTAILSLDKLYDTDNSFKHKFRAIKNILHPFGNINLRIDSSLVGEQKATNAFMKMYEFMEIFHPKFKSLFDIASSPGMFVIAAAHKLLASSGDILQWDACSYIPPTESMYLQDDYSLFKSNKDHFYNVNVLVDDDCLQLLDKVGKYDLVTGDIGSIHGYNDLQEDVHTTLQYRQAYLALNLVNQGGNIFLKMYSCINNNTIYLINVLQTHFENLYLWKPYTSRILNNEVYIVGINKNYKVPDLPLQWKDQYPFQENTQLFYSFFYKLARKRLSLVNGYLNKNKLIITNWQQEMRPILKMIKHLNNGK
ncbi:hypothetical protein H8356DRAFT_1740897 [Neocallimastix lanati (nom. inval.)]|jgi:23S rRNA U2552 (ribose-2'-O)-methylase RlmE/FtsJ|uniref:Cap-specific mRNA (nucleoside-2'-O-)-methyltransferase 1 n=1 Tax=Neocallimastix californiae TaxID=1754190 RepID=A0A1Y2A1W0_9FUNG|nr:hypothetical protein H8356DRAFT_1740897 [Neocallimastix sp. JGI-2020a]ORY16511.1 hypothetical protein LY90DRAFT_677441 [Neocallimastix californiae]|eukprot:ORY16511.1 hypothetical protein LY90DRAFT_677441 [Neocallimastix californiae]